MLCPNCGAEITNDSAFCDKCGAKIVLAQNQAAPAQASAPKKPILDDAKKEFIKKNLKFIIPALVLLLVIIIVIIVLVASSANTVNLNNYVTVTVEGYNGLGKATVEIDREKLEADYPDEIASTDSWGFSYSYTLADKIDDYFEYELDKDSNLSNGDEVTLTWTLDEEDIQNFKEKYGYKLKYKDITVSVSDLTEVETFDPFANDNVKVEFSGVSPSGRAEIVIDDDYRLSYDLDCSSGLSNGDTVTVSIDLSEDELESYLDNNGKLPSPMSKTFEVSGLPSYVEELSEISDIDAANELSKSTLKSRFDEDYYSVKSLEDVGNYLMVRKENTSGGYCNLLGFVYKITVTKLTGTNAGKDHTYYVNLAFKEVTTQTDWSGSEELNYSLSSNSIKYGSGWLSSYSFYGYETLDELIEEELNDNADYYYIEKNINE